MNNTLPHPVTSQAVVPASHASIPGHFPGHPVVPGVVLLSYVEQALRARLGPAVRIDAVPAVKFIAPLAPGRPFVIQLEPGTATTVRFAIRDQDALVASGTFRLRPGADGSDGP